MSRDRIFELLQEVERGDLDVEAALEQLATEGYDPAYGARPLKRVIQNRLLDPLSLDLLDGKFKDGDTITVDIRDGHYTFSL